MNKKCRYAGMLMLSAAMAFFASSCSNSETFAPEEEQIEQTVNDGYVTGEEAIRIAQEFIKNGQMDQDGKLRSTSTPELNIVYTDANSTRSGDANHPSYYVINIDTTGFVIVSASEVTYPVLGFSNETKFAPEIIPDGMRGLLGNYAAEVKVAAKALKASKETELMRSLALRGELSDLRATTSVAPLLGNIRWNQQPYYNQYCPTGTPVGCVATATCQIMRYWGYPAKGIGSHTSTSDGQVANFNHALNWNNMPRETLRTWNTDVAHFCYDVAVGLNMQFSTSGSGTWQTYVPGLLVNHYYYANTARYVERTGYTTAQWMALLRQELNAGRPIQYAGYGSGGGHSFVCDGYTDSGYFHFNWGWGGSSDGYFLLHAMNPGSLGVGGGSGGFNSGHNIVIGIQPQGEEPNPEPNPEPEPEMEYCSSRGQYAVSTYIANVKVGTMNNASYGSNTGYVNFGKKFGNIYRGYYYELAVTPGNTTYNTYTEYWRAWVDWNNNNIFESSEVVLNGYTYGATVLKKQMYIPTNIRSGLYRMRVSMKWGGYPEPCENFTYGEVEDYTLNVH